LPFDRIKRALPAPLKRRLHRSYARLRYRGDRRWCPVCGSSVAAFLPAGLEQRPDARCPICGALERHRLVTLFWQRCTELFDRAPLRVLHIAPEAALQPLFRSARELRYVTSDLFASDVSLRMDLSSIAVQSNVIDVLYCSHVLEHVPDDRRAMREMARVLKPGGWAVLQVPITADRTFEDLTLDPAERLRIFGQDDHVRRYGSDFGDRVREAGFLVATLTAERIAGSENLERLGLAPDEQLFFCVTQPNAAWEQATAWSVKT
jgi:SAM-dependent methyltransferase